VTLALAALGAAANAWANGKLGAMKLPTTVTLQRLRTAEDFRRTTALWETPRTRPDAWRCLRAAFCFDLVLIVGYAGAIASAATLLASWHPAQAGVLAAATALAVAAAVADLAEDALELRMIYVNLEGLAAADGQRFTEDVFARAAFVATCLKWAFLAGAVGALAWGLAAGWMTGG
jgi:hypothetical protein